MEERADGTRRQNGPEIVATQQSRSGEVSGHLRWMLAAGITLVVGAFVVVYVMFFKGH